jgi:hypothetical protein
MHIKLSQVKKFYFLTRKEKIIMLRAIYWIIFMWIVVRCTSSNYLIHWLGMPSSKLKQENVFYIDSHVIYAQKIFSYACKIINLDNACLIYALAAKQYLKYLKLPIKLYLGVKKENSKFIFHAWLYCGQQKFVGYVGEEQYTILAIFD